MSIGRERLLEMKELARRDDCFTAYDGFVPSDIRGLIMELEAAYIVMNRMADIAVDFGERFEKIADDLKVE